MRSVAAVALAALLLVSGVPVTAQSTTGDGQIAEASYAGDTITQLDNETAVWRSSDHEFAVTLESSDGLDDAVVCVGWADATDESTLACEAMSVPAGTATEVTVAIPDWPANRTGAQDVRLGLRAPNASGAVLDDAVRSVTALDEEGDLDGDGLANRQEVATGADLRTADTDGDGLADGPEVHAYGSSPTNADSDNDGLGDGAEVQDHRTDPTEADTDDDGLQDARELEVGADPNRADSDGDGLLDGAEIHTHETNATNADTDGDGLDDGTEVDEEGTNPTDADTDDDGLVDGLEVNTYGTDPTEVDTDGDGLEDGPEVHQYRTDPAEADTDGDGLDDGAEVNEFDTDPTKPDTDGDGLDDGAEVNRFETDPTNPDTDGDGVPDPQEVDTAPLSLPLVVGVGLPVLIGAGTLLYWFVRRRRSGREPSQADRSSPDDGAAEPGGEATDAVPQRALPNRDRVLALLDEHDGRMQQSDVVEATEWSKSKVSRVLSEMEEQGQIDKISLGRENLVTRPEDRSPGSQPPSEE